MYSMSRQQTGGRHQNMDRRPWHTREGQVYALYLIYRIKMLCIMGNCTALGADTRTEPGFKGLGYNE